MIRVRFTPAAYTKVERMVAAEWRTVGSRFSSDDGDDLRSLVLLAVAEFLPSLPPDLGADEVERRIVGFARTVAKRAITDLVTGVRRDSDDDGVTRGLSSIVSGPSATEYADDTEDPEEPHYTRGVRGSASRTRGTLPTVRNSAGADVPTEDAVAGDIDARRAKARVVRRPARKRSSTAPPAWGEVKEIDILSENFLQRIGLGR